MKTLHPAQRRALRAEAHHLHPVVSIGHQGLTPAVLHEIDVSLLAHELVKIRVFSDDRDAREALLQQVCEALDAAPVQHLGKVLVLYRPAPVEEPEAQSRTRERRSPSAAARGERPAGAGIPNRGRPDARVPTTSPGSPRRRRVEPLTASKAREMTGTTKRKPGTARPLERRWGSGSAKPMTGAGQRRTQGASGAGKGRVATGAPAAQRRSPAAPPSGVPRTPGARRRRG